MMWRKLWRKKAARCMAFMLALSLVFPGTVHAAFAADGTPNEEVYGENQEPSDGLLDENEAMEAEAAGQIDDFGLLTGDGTAADALSAEEDGEGAEENEIIPETVDESLFPADETGEAGDEAAVDTGKTVGAQATGEVNHATQREDGLEQDAAEQSADNLRDGIAHEIDEVEPAAHEDCKRNSRNRQKSGTCIL